MQVLSFCIFKYIYTHTHISNPLKVSVRSALLHNSNQAARGEHRAEGGQLIPIIQLTPVVQLAGITRSSLPAATRCPRTASQQLPGFWLKYVLLSNKNNSCLWGSSEFYNLMASVVLSLHLPFLFFYVIVCFQCGSACVTHRGVLGFLRRISKVPCMFIRKY